MKSARDFQSAPIASESRPARDPRRLSVPGVRLGAEPRAEGTPVWSLAAFAGRLAEVSGDAAGSPLTLVFRLVLEAQRRGEPVAWIGRRSSPFFPPDVAEAGVDLAGLPVVWASDALAAAGAADLLVRSGAFGLVAVDLGAAASLPIAAQTRLAGLASQHGAAVVLITEKDGARPSVGSLVSLRVHAVRAERPSAAIPGEGTNKDREPEGYRCEARALKDKRRGPGWRHAEWCRGPDGLC